MIFLEQVLRPLQEALQRVRQNDHFILFTIWEFWAINNHTASIERVTQPPGRIAEKQNWGQPEDKSDPEHEPLDCITLFDVTDEQQLLRNN